MSQEWETLARQIADLKRQRDELLRQLVEVTRDRDTYKAAYEVQDLQRRTVKGNNHVH